MKKWLSLLLALTLSSGNVFADRIKDLANVAAPVLGSVAIKAALDAITPQTLADMDLGS
jgi:hypothetical protein